MRAACALVVAAVLACNKVPISVAKAQPTENFPTTWDGDVVRADNHAATAVAAVPPELQIKSAAVKRAKAVAVVIGIEKYRAELPAASGAEGDATLFADYVEKVLGVPRANIQLLIGSGATKSSIEAELDEWLPKNVTANDWAFFYFAGHGAPDTTGDKRYLVPWDADPKFIASQGINTTTLAQKLSALRGARVMAFLDACFSGAGGRSVLAQGTRPLVLQHVTATFAASAVQRANVTFFSAAGPNEVTGVGPAGHGLFSYYVMRGLNGDSMVTPTPTATAASPSTSSGVSWPRPCRMTRAVRIAISTRNSLAHRRR
jgi:hypothetical protein